MKNRGKILYVLAALLLLGFGFFLWEYVNYAEAWATYPGAPHIFGIATVTDRTGKTLTHTQDALLRQATIHWLGDKQGNIRAPAAEIQRPYDFLNGLYSYGGFHPKIRLTLQAELQKAALSALGEYRGTVAIINYETGEILCAVSAPTFDPEKPGGTVESMYLNRFTQGLYTPGSIFKLVTLAAALEENPSLVEQAFLCTGTLNFGENKVTCPYPHGRQTLGDAFANSCNCVFGKLATDLGGERLAHYAQKFGVLESLSFDGITTARGKYEMASSVDLAWSGAGQFTTLINPCSFLTFVCAVASGGEGVNPYVVSRVEEGRKTLYSANRTHRERILSAETARKLQVYLRANVRDKYENANFAGLTVCAKTGTAEVGSAKPNAMLCGFLQDGRYPVAFLICVEEGGYGEKTCIPIAGKLLKMLVDS